MLLACTGAGSPGTADVPAQADGLWRITIAVGRQYTYTGTLTVTAEGDALTGVLAIIAPATVNAHLRGSDADGTLALAGPYTSGSGCTGTMTIAVRGKGNRRSGPAELIDGCVGTLDATATLSR
jgi:hypothetical protein